MLLRADRAELLRELGKRVKQFRKANRITQGDLADVLGVDRSLISKIECGRRCPRIDELAVIARECSLTVSELVDGIEPWRHGPEPSTVCLFMTEARFLPWKL